MVGHDQEIERPLQPGSYAVGGRYRFTLGEPVGVVRSSRGANQTCIGGIARMKMGIAKQDLVWEIVLNIWRILGVWDWRHVDQFLGQSGVRAKQEAGPH